MHHPRPAAPRTRAQILLLLPHNGVIFDFPNSNPLLAAFLLEMCAIAATRNVRGEQSRQVAKADGRDERAAQIL